MKGYRKTVCQALVFCILILAPGAAKPDSAGEKAGGWAEWLAFSGWLDTMTSFRIESPHDKVTARAGLRLEAKADFDWLYAFYSLDAEKNWVIDRETGIDTQEFWVEYVRDAWDMRIGRQIIIWGQADGVQITDLISPPDLTESITRDLDEIRMPVDAVRFRVLGDTLTSELILIPFFQGAVYPEGDNPWAVPAKSFPGRDVSVLPTEEPDTSFANMEIAAKISAYLSGLDLAASVFHTWDDTPAVHPSMEIQGEDPLLVIRPKHHRLTVAGLEFSFPWEDFVFRGEAAFYKGRYLARHSPVQDALARNLIKWLAGVDWTPGNDWSIIAQLVGESIFDYQEDLAARQNSFLATLNISRKLINQRLTISNMVYLDFDNSGFYDRLKVDYEVLDGFHLSAGLDIFQGHEGQFAIYEDNSQLWIKAKYNF